MGIDTKYRASDLKNTQMIKFTAIFYNAFRAPHSQLREESAVRKSREEIVRARTHGNIRLQLGHWYTQGDVNDWRESFREYSFT